MLTRILYPIDLSPRSQRGLSWITERVLKKDSQLVTVHIVDTAAGTETPRYVHDARITLQTLCDTIIPEDISCKVIVKAGNIMDDLPEIAHQEKCTFAIIPVKESTDPVPLVKKMAIPQFLLRARNGSFLEEDVFSRIVVAVDLSPERTYHLLENLKNILADSEITPSITLLHGVPLEDAGQSQELVHSATDALEEVREEVSRWNTNTSSEIVSGQPEEELPGKIADLDPTLLVLGLTIHSEMWGLILGSTAESLLEKANCPVLIIPS
jgi:nucleotide-binding universal stress UspA family protein